MSDDTPSGRKVEELYERLIPQLQAALEHAGPRFDAESVLKWYASLVGRELNIDDDAARQMIESMSVVATQFAGQGAGPSQLAILGLVQGLGMGRIARELDEEQLERGELP
jgi:hypothetical protein